MRTSINVRPAFPALHLEDGAAADIKLRSQFRSSHLPLKRANGANVDCLQLCVSVLLATQHGAVVQPLLQILRLSLPSQVPRSHAAFVALATPVCSYLIRNRGSEVPRADQAVDVVHCTVQEKCRVAATDAPVWPHKATGSSVLENHFTVKTLGGTSRPFSRGADRPSTQRIAVLAPAQVVRVAPPVPEMWPRAVWNRTILGHQNLTVLGVPGKAAFTCRLASNLNVARGSVR